jgi:Type II secretion system (T2SS), protein G
MPISLTCVCGAPLEVDDQQRGSTVKCSACGHVLTAEAATPRQAKMPTPTKSFTGVWITLAVGGLLLTCCGFSCSGAAIVFLVKTNEEEGKKQLAAQQVNGPLTQAAQAFFIRHARWPVSLDELAVPDAFGTQHIQRLDQLLDPWGRPYSYDPGGPNNQGIRPDIWTVAPDGTQIGNWPGARK